MSVEDLEENALNLGEEIDVLSDDLADVEEAVFDEDGEEYDDDWFEERSIQFDEDSPELSQAMFKAFKCSVAQRNRRKKNA